MGSEKKRGKEIRDFIINNISNNTHFISKLICQEFNISRQAAYKHLNRLENEGVLSMTKYKNRNSYHLAPAFEWTKIFSLINLEEDYVWRKFIEPELRETKKNQIDIFHYGVTEIINNAIDHSEGDNVTVLLSKTILTTQIWIIDNGVGIFKKIKRELKLEDEREAILELSKGKLTTDPKHHSGEGIFFCSKMFDNFSIYSGEICYTHDIMDDADWIIDMTKPSGGTSVFMELKHNTQRTASEVHDEYSDKETYEFSKTIIPVHLAKYGDELLISRSQAKRLLNRVDKFKTVIFDFEGVDTIGQAFADEVFRVFKNIHPNIELVPVKMKKKVKQMVYRAMKLKEKVAV